MNTTYLIGAYERENFGDILFLELTEKYLNHGNVIATAPFSQAPTNYLPREIIQFDEAVKKGPPDVVWSVGGEMGGTSMANAYRMSASSAEFESFDKLSVVAKRRRIKGLAIDPDRSPYLPRMSGLETTYGSKFVVNSSGLSGMRRLLGNRRIEAWGAVKEAGFVSVRDSDSHSTLSSMNIPHTLAPDLVHTLPRHFNLRQNPQSDLALVQINGATLRRLGVELVASAIATSRQLDSYEIRLFIAGSARGHDDVELYRQVVDKVKKMNRNRHIEISTANLALEKASEIANCGIWIGTSLHGLIISSAFNVPRVGLELVKLKRYASTWKDAMPVGVSFQDVDSAIKHARELPSQTAYASRLESLAHDNMLKAVDYAVDGEAPCAEERSTRSRKLQTKRLNPINNFLPLLRG